MFSFKRLSTKMVSQEAIEGTVVRKLPEILLNCNSLKVKI